MDPVTGLRKYTFSAPVKEQEEEEFGEYDQPKTVIYGGKQSFFSRVSVDQNMNFLNRSPLSRFEGLTQMTVWERAVFTFLVVVRPISFLLDIVRFKQKTKEWKWARKGRITGSITASAVGQLRMTRVLKAAWDTAYRVFEGFAATDWGSGKEVYGTQSYANDFAKVVTKVFRQQRLQGKIKTHFEFRGQQIPVPDINKDPVVEVRHFGLLIDPWNHWRGVSPDGVIFVNGVACGVLEIKCPYAKKNALYVNIKPYYYNQIQCEMYICRLYWPTIQWVDFMVWSPTNFTVETFGFDEDYFFSYYAGLETRFYFKGMLSAITESMLFLTEKEMESSEKTREQVFDEVLRKELSLEINSKLNN